MAATKAPMTAEEMQAILDDPAAYLSNIKYDSSAPPDLRTRDEQIEAMRAHLAHMKEIRPETMAPIADKGEWYIPGIDFNIEMRERLSEEKHKEYSDAMGKMTKTLFNPDMFGEIRAEAMAALEGHEDLQKTWDEIFGGGETFKGMHEYLTTGKNKEEIEKTAREEAKAKDLPVPAVD